MTTRSGYCAYLCFTRKKAVELGTFPRNSIILVRLWDVITPLFVVHHLTSSRQGNMGPLPPPHLLIGCLCWLRHTGLAGPVVAGQRFGQWRFLKSCRSVAGIQRRLSRWAAPLVWTPLPALWGWMREVRRKDSREECKLQQIKR